MSGAPSFELRPYGPGDEERFLPLLRASLGESAAAPQSREFWAWKHLANPFGHSYGVYAWDEEVGRALALRVLMRWRFSDPAGGHVAAVRAVDTATDARCRRMGLFTALTTRAMQDLGREGAAFIFNTPNGSSLPGYLKMGWQVVAAWPVYVRVLRPLHIAASLAGSRRGTAAGLPPWEEYFRGNALRWHDFRARYGGAVASVLEGGERIRPRRGFRTERTVHYLDWRYGGHPGVAYTVVPAVRAGALAGFAVLRPNVRRGLREVVLAELLLAEADPALARELLGLVARAVRADYVAAHFSADTTELGALQGSGYIKMPGKSVTFTVRRLGATGADPSRHGDWDLSAGDLELF